MMTRARKTAAKSEASFEPQQSQFASRPFATRAEEHEAPAGESRVSFSLADIDIFPRETVQPRQTHTMQQGQMQEAGRVLQAKEEAMPNRTGMPDGLKSGLEALSGMDLSEVRVHRNSPKPAQLNALAYTQGREIYVAPGQERHLPHEAWHVVQQARGKVKPTMQARGFSINDNEGLEHEADVMAAKILPYNVHRYFSQEKAVEFRSTNQRVPALTQMFIPKNAKENKQLHELKIRFLQTKNDDDFYEQEFYSFVEKAKSMEEIKDFVSELEEKKKIATAHSTAPPLSVGEPTITKPIATSSSLSTMPMARSSSSQTPKKSGKKKKKFIPLGINVAASTKQSGEPPSILMVDEEPVVVPSNQFVSDLIQAKGVFTVKSIAVDGESTIDTVYYTILVLGPIQQPGIGQIRPFRNSYTLYLHYHPNPPQGQENNWLHIKKAHSASAGNKVTVDCWLFAKHMEILRQGMSRWENTYKQKATKKF
jgi:hypothetical protein